MRTLVGLIVEELREDPGAREQFASLVKEILEPPDRYVFAAELKTLGWSSWQMLRAFLPDGRQDWIEVIDHRQCILRSNLEKVELPEKLKQWHDKERSYLARRASDAAADRNAESYGPPPP